MTPFVTRARFLGAVLVVVALAGAAGCSKDKRIKDYNVDAVDLTIGTGLIANTGNVIQISFVGWLRDQSKPDNKGAMFTTTEGAVFPAFVLGAGYVIQGIDIGVVGMKVGGVRRLTIPPELAFGVNGSQDGSVPGNTYVIYEVTLNSVQ